ncbi:ArgE/DapE family deacylase [Agrobacterium vitis]|uniref:Probable succinyl-diaminopimelate desuccinylase n=1 Tax=Agrobacterium vitis TaxID=373 RepID=A0A6L6VIN7_AGRVI|nr:ArgE/DapE family deacylase [Agrobacterium vitis]MUZ74748.1 ArgE/DapE family deacylase [Agrobacterium vitis]
MANLNERVTRAVEKNFDAQLEFLENLVRRPSLRNGEGEAQEIVALALERRGYIVDRFRTDATKIGHHPAFSPSTVDYENSWNIVGRMQARRPTGQSLAFNSHVDVVPAASAHRWTKQPFEPYRQGDWLYGRGAGDMKAGLAASIFALDAITDAGLELCGDVQIQSVVEEEITGNGAATLFANGCVADVVFSPEPTDEVLVRANSGVIKFRISTRGRPAHPREPQSGRSAIELMFHLITRLRELENQWNEESWSHPGFRDLANPVALTIGTINGGDWIASIPSDCSVEGRIGFYPGDDPKVRAMQFESFIEKLREDDPLLSGDDLVSLEWIACMHPGYWLAEGSSAETCLNTMHQFVNAGAPLRSEVMACYLDAAVFAVHGGIPSLVYGPIAENIHGIDERVSLSSLLRVTKTMALFAAEWCGTRERG